MGVKYPRPLDSRDINSIAKILREIAAEIVESYPIEANALRNMANKLDGSRILKN